MESTTSTPASSPLPSFTLLYMDKIYEKAFKSAATTYVLPSSINITYSYNRFNELTSSTQFDTIVSPANSYGLMDGGFDDALSRAFSQRGDYFALTRVAKNAIYREFRGMAPPSSCVIAPLEGEEDLVENVWGCKFMAICPTMIVPQPVKWDREVVYECTWALCAAIDRHNRKVKESGEGSEIKTVMMTPFATGVGWISAEKWAAQTVLAFKHFAEAVEKEEEWKEMDWSGVRKLHREVERTHQL